MHFPCVWIINFTGSCASAIVFPNQIWYQHWLNYNINWMNVAEVNRVLAISNEYTFIIEYVTHPSRGIIVWHTSWWGNSGSIWLAWRWFWCSAPIAHSICYSALNNMTSNGSNMICEWLLKPFSVLVVFSVPSLFLLDHRY